MRLPATDNDDKHAFFVRMILAEISETVIKDRYQTLYIVSCLFRFFNIFLLG